MQAMRNVIATNNNRSLSLFCKICFDRGDFTFQDISSRCIIKIRISCCAGGKSNFDLFTDRKFTHMRPSCGAATREVIIANDQCKHA